MKASSWDALLNSPAWFVFQEHVANLFYAKFGRRISLRCAGGKCGRGGAAVCLPGRAKPVGRLELDTVGTGSLRVSASFSIGLLIHRRRLSVPLQFAFPTWPSYSSWVSRRRRWGAFRDASTG